MKNRNAQNDIRNKTYEEIRQEYLSKGILFEDPEFPANDRALFFSQRPKMIFEWKRPHVCVHLHTQFLAVYMSASKTFYHSAVAVFVRL